MKHMKMKIGTLPSDHIVDQIVNNGVFMPSEKFIKNTDSYKKLLSTGLVEDVLESSFKKTMLGNDLYDSMLAMMLRDHYIAQYGFVLLNKKLLNTLGERLQGKQCIEVGAGTGFLSSQIQNLGVDITAVDRYKSEQNTYGFNKNYIDIIEQDAITYLRHINNSNPPNVVIMSWPCMGTSFSDQILSAMLPGQKLIYIGEFGGCTASDNFFDLLEEKTSLDESFTKELQKNSLRFPGIKDNWYVYDIV